MRDRKFLVMAMGVFVLGIFVFSLVNVGLHFTGFAIFGNSGLDFDDGVYNNTFYNGSGVVLSSGNLTGSYVSKVFDAGYNAKWNNLSWEGGEPFVDFLFGVDAASSVYSSNNSGVGWFLKTSDYGDGGTNLAHMFSDDSYLYILFSSTNKKVYRSGDFGVNWDLVSTLDGVGLSVGDSDSEGNLYIAKANGEVWKSSDGGVNWVLQGDANGGASDASKGIAIDSNDFIFVVDGSGAVWKSINQGVAWTQQTSGYGGSIGTDDMKVDSSNNLYILLNKQIYKSVNGGVNWSVVNNSFTSYSNDGTKMAIDGEDNIFVTDLVGRIFKSTDLGISWSEVGDFNGADNSGPKGLTNFLVETGLFFQVRNCSSSDCSDGVWQSVDLNNLNLQGRYFQYKVGFSSEGVSMTPFLESVILDYTPLVYTAYVDDDFNSETEGWGITHFDNINDALEIVQAGGEIYVADGTYNEKLTISKSVNLSGNGWENTIINGGGSGNVITINVAGVNISNFTIKGSGTSWGNSGIYFGSVGDSVIRGNYFLGNRIGISLISSPRNLVISNYIVNSTEYGIYSNNWATQNNYIYNNYFSNSNNFYAASRPPNLAYFNITKTAGMNILGKEYIGGNYWNNYGGADRGDGFGDVPFNFYGSYYDYLPLVENSAPVLDIISPQLLNYVYNQEINLTYSVIDDDLESCWYILNSESPINLPNCENATFYAPAGNNILYVYANDSSGLIGSDNVSFNSVNTAPIINLVEPSEGTTYGYNESIDLKFLVEDSEGDKESCWYNVNGGENISLDDCLNSTFDVSGNGEYVLRIYANDSLGLVSGDDVSFDVVVGAPTISLSYPVEIYLRDGGNVSFDYTPSDIDLDSCELWGNFDGGFDLNQVDVFPTSGDVNNFYLNLNDGEYLWNVKCNDSVGNFAFNGNKTFYVDSANPSVSLSQPSGRKTSRTVFSSWSVIDASPTSCKYNVYRGGNVEIANTSVNCSAGAVSFGVTIDADFVFNFYVNDSAGNSNFKNLSFSVDTSSTVTNPSSGGSSGGGGGYFVDSSSRLKIGEIDVIVSRGEEKNLLAEVKNIGGTSANKCVLVGGNFIDSNDIFNIGVGEIVEFEFVLRALDGVENLELRVNCLDNISGIVPLNVEILKSSLDVSILGIRVGSKNNLEVDYSVMPTRNSESVLYFRIFDSNENIVSEVIESVNFILGEVYNGNVVMSVGDAKKGMLRIAVSDGDINFVEEDFIYGGGIGMTGFVLLDWIGDFSYIGIILVVFLVLAVLLVRRIWRLKKNRRH